MPTHVHALLLPIEPWPLGKIVQGIKSVTSRQIARDLDLKASLWSPDYFDVWIRDVEHFERTLNYIEWNPVKAKLCQDPANWPHSSANETARKYVLSL